MHEKDVQHFRWTSAFYRLLIVYDSSIVKITLNDWERIAGFLRRVRGIRSNPVEVFE